VTLVRRYARWVGPVVASGRRSAGCVWIEWCGQRAAAFWDYYIYVA